VCGPSGPRCSMPPTPPIPSASSTRPRRRPCSRAPLDQQATGAGGTGGRGTEEIPKSCLKGIDKFRPQRSSQGERSSYR
jgi:hypothetical protein